MDIGLLSSMITSPNWDGNFKSHELNAINFPLASALQFFDKCGLHELPRLPNRPNAYNGQTAGIVQKLLRNVRQESNQMSSHLFPRFLKQMLAKSVAPLCTLSHPFAQASKVGLVPLFVKRYDIDLLRNDRQCQAMLFRLWAPLLWRHLCVANAVVRQNATEILFNAFPLEDPEAPVMERSINMDRQYKLMLQLLQDESPDVRILAIHGICRTIAVYWVLIPLDTLNQAINIIVKDMAFDASSFKVRLAVVKGLHMMLECDQSHVFLKSVLPRISDCLHDINESVRIAMLDLLTSVKKIRSIQYWNICSLDDLLARLEVDTVRVCRKIVSLLFNSFFPLDKSDDSKIERCIYLIKENRKASRKFYEHTERFMNIHDCIKFLLTIFLKLSKYAKGEMNKLRVENFGNDENDKENSDRIQNKGKKQRKLLSSSNSVVEESYSDSSNSTSGVLTETNNVISLIAIETAWMSM